MDLTGKAIYVAGGNLTNYPSSVTYASVDCRDIVRLSFLIVALNYLDILARDIHNAYFNALTNENYFSTLVMNGNPTNEKLMLLLDISMV